MSQGKYLLTAVAGCTDCHGAKLHGAPLPFGPIVKLPPGMHWAKVAPNVVTLMRSGSAAKWATFLETGVDPRGGHAADAGIPHETVGCAGGRCLHQVVTLGRAPGERRNNGAVAR